jgi:hypothetical protein
LSGSGDCGCKLSRRNCLPGASPKNEAVEAMMIEGHLAWHLLALSVIAVPYTTIADDVARRPANDAELRFWLENMLAAHRYSLAEATAATGLSADEIADAVKRLKIDPAAKPPRAPDAPLLVLPYPGGRHPRIGFLEGAVNPQRETKLSIFAPWNDGGYAVADIPEAIWMQTETGRELLYLAHTHVPTHWTKQGVTLLPLEWQQTADGWLVERTLPNKVVFGTQARALRDRVTMEMWLRNGTDKTLRGLVVQNCVMLKGLAGFEQQTNDNKRFRQPYVACHNTDRNRWIITAWEPCHRAWGNAPCPCLHSDPRFPDCEPGQTVRLRGWLSFYEGTHIQSELARIAETGWNR